MTKPDSDEDRLSNYGQIKTRMTGAEAGHTGTRILTHLTLQMCKAPDNERANASEMDYKKIHLISSPVVVFYYIKYCLS